MATEPNPSPDTPTAAARSPWRRLRWVLIGGVGLVVVVYAAIFIYANFINDPEEALTAADLETALQADPTPAETAAPNDSLEPAVTAPVTTIAVPLGAEGQWFATPASELGYRVVEVLFGVNTEGVGRTNQVTGELTVVDTRVTEAQFTVDMASIESDDGRRDGQFRGRIMTVNEFPTATFVLTEPIELESIPAEGEQITAQATGELTLRGVTNPVTFEVTAQLQNERIGVLGNISVVFADYEIANPSIAGITTEDNGLLEFVLVFER
jgi:polyisoprenoid-binding protein YceI